MNQPLEVYDERGAGFYRGRRIHAVAQLHAVALNLIQQLPLAGDRRCLDLGAGSGAFPLRLKDHGFLVEAVEQTALDLSAEAIPVHPLDLNDSDFAVRFPVKEKTYPLLVCLEVIEHLENPFSFFRNCRKLLSPGGFLVVSSPNLESWSARIKFFATGNLPWFGQENFTVNQHLIPHFSWQMPIMARQAGLTLVRTENTPNKFLMWAGPINPIAMSGKLIARFVLSPFLRGQKNGDLNLFVFRAS